MSLSSDSKNSAASGQRTVLILAGVTIFLVLAIIFAFVVKHQDAKSFADSIEAAQNGMTLFQTIQSGGWVMVVLGLLSMATSALIIFLFIRMNLNTLVAPELAHSLIGHLRARKNGLVRQLCLENKNLITGIILEGLDRVNDSSDDAKDAVEIAAKKEVTGLWQYIGYLADIAAIAPMIGLLGTVLGMIQAFNAIAFQTAVVKPVLLAGGVSKAMVTTAAGMIIAIVAMSFYSVFRTKVQYITNTMEVLVNDIINSLSPEKKTQAASAK